MSSSEEEIYSLMFSSLKHPARRKILRMLSGKTMTFSQMLEELAIPSSHLTYHLENLGDLIVKDIDGKYKLSSFGRAAVSIMKGAEEAPSVNCKRFSALPLRWKTLYAALLITIALLSTIAFVQYTSFNQLSTNYDQLKVEFDKIQSQNQQLLSWSTSANKAMAVIRDVVQFDVSKYQAKLDSNTVEDRVDMGGVIEEVIRYSFENAASRIELTLRFRNNHFSLFRLNQLEGFPSYPPLFTKTQPRNLLQASTELLERYNAVMGEPYLEEMRQLLKAANETTVDQTLGNTRLRMSISGGNAEIWLFYTANGTDFASKRVHIVYQNYVLTELSDDWNLYKVGTTEVNVSSEQAIQIAKNAARSYSWNAEGQQVSDFEILDSPVSADFYPHTRSEPLTLVPYWYVTLHLDKTYPGGVNVIAVGVWADTGEIANIQALGDHTP
ncbi:MAG: winged helix-turn-helix domain-containing protein [Candidatus Bathyarchaeia archaeon]|jgi:DNA-binding transcriptional ArsR family regulator